MMRATALYSILGLIAGTAALAQETNAQMQAFEGYNGNTYVWTDPGIAFANLNIFADGALQIQLAHAIADCLDFADSPLHAVLCDTQFQGVPTAFRIDSRQMLKVSEDHWIIGATIEERTFELDFKMQPEGFFITFLHDGAATEAFFVNERGTLRKPPAGQELVAPPSPFAAGDAAFTGLFDLNGQVVSLLSLDGEIIGTIDAIPQIYGQHDPADPNTARLFFFALDGFRPFQAAAAYDVVSSDAGLSLQASEIKNIYRAVYDIAFQMVRNSGDARARKLDWSTPGIPMNARERAWVQFRSDKAPF